MIYMCIYYTHMYIHTCIPTYVHDFMALEILLFKGFKMFWHSYYTKTSKELLLHK